MILFSVEEFAAKRTKDQDALEKVLAPKVKAWLTDEDTHLDDLLDAIRDAFADVYAAAGGTKKPSAALFLRQVKAALKKGGEPDAHTVDRISIWLATGILNAATVQASKHDPDEIELAWVTMRDEDVRDTHKAAEGQTRAPNEFYDVGGHRMRYPGDPSAPIELWINCRCSLAPKKAEALVAAGGEVMDPETDDTTEEETETTEEAVAVAVPWHGVLAPEGVFSGDGRMFAEGSLTVRPLPLPLTWQKSSSDGHSGSVTVAKIDRVWRHGNEMRAEGTMLFTPEADEVIGLLAEFKRFGVSVDADNAEMEFDDDNETVTFTKGRIASASIVAIPAFAEAWVALGPWEEGEGPTDEEGVEVEAPEEEEKKDEALVASVVSFKRGPGWLTDPVATKRIHDYWTKPGEEGYAKINWGVGGDFNRCRVLVGEKIAENSPEDLRFINNICAQWHHDALGYWPAEHLSVEDAPTPTEEVGVREGPVLVASGGHVAPADWFANPEFTEVSPIRVTKEGRVFGHIADWTTCHISPAFAGTCVTAPHSASGYAYFMTGYVETDKGEVPTGALTIGGPHAPNRLRAAAAMAHYDNTCTAVADVTVGEDEHGIWCAGWVRPGATDEMVTALRASALSGDWRLVGGEMEMIAALAVNVQGLPIPRVKVAAQNGKQVSLVAAGFIDPGQHKVPEIDMDKFADAVMLRIVERQERKARMAALAARMNKEEAGI